MERRDFVNLFLAAPAAFVASKSQAQNAGNKLVQQKISFEEAFVTVSPKNNFYFELSNGDPYIVTGPCLSGAADMATMESYLKKIAANGGNFARVWLCNRLFEVEKKFGEYDESQAKKIDQLLNGQPVIRSK